MSKMQCSPRTEALLNTNIKVGEHSVNLSATWVNEMEYGHMSPNAALFWSEHADQLYAGCDLSEVLDSLVDEGLIEPDQLEEIQKESDYLEGEDTEYVRQGIQFEFPSALFEGTQFGSTDAIFPLSLEEYVRWKMQTDTAAKLHCARQRLCWASIATKRSPGSPASDISLDLVEYVGAAHQAQFQQSRNKYFHIVADADSDFFPDPGPCVWCHTKGWKGSSGSVVVKVKQQMTLGEFLQRELSANVGWINDELFCNSLDFDGLDPDWEEWNCKCADMEVVPPALPSTDN